LDAGGFIRVDLLCFSLGKLLLIVENWEREKRTVFGKKGAFLSLFFSLSWN
jgi:hypothetical protein